MTDNSTLPTEDTQQVNSLLRFVMNPKVLFIVSKDRFQALSPQLQSFATNANLELISKIGLEIKAGLKDIYVFSSESAFYQGVVKVKEISKYSKFEFVPIYISMILFIQELDRFQPNAVYVDYGHDDSFEIHASKIGELEEYLAITRLAKLKYLYVLQEKGGIALSMEIDSGNYAVGFLELDDSESTVEGLRQNNISCRVEKNRIIEVVSNISDSDFSGIILNPMQESQVILSIDKIKKLQRLLDIMEPEARGIVDRIKNLFAGTLSK
jgi:hypothetical protein